VLEFEFMIAFVVARKSHALLPCVVQGRHNTHSYSERNKRSAEIFLEENPNKTHAQAEVVKLVFC
jgi:hypothetical protein